MLASGWDKGGIYSTDILSGDHPKEDSNYSIEKKFREFLENFRIGNTFIYREQIKSNVNAKKYVVDVDMNDLVGYNQSLASNLQTQPTVYYQMFEQASRSYASTFYNRANEDNNVSDPFVDFQVLLHYTNARPSVLRELNSSYVGKLVRIPGIVISASTVVSKPSQAYIMCRNCYSHKIIPVNSSFGGVSLPRTCLNSNPVKDGGCPLDPYFIVTDKSVCVDQQTLKLQEAPDAIPVGELPRHVLLTVERNLVNLVAPGSKITVNGVFSIFQSKSSSNKNNASSSVAIRSPYIKVVGIESEGDNSLSRGSHVYFSDDEERGMIEFSKRKNILKLFVKNIAPSIFGNEDVKLAIACLLFGGSRKFLPDGIKIRGDINVLLLGDPGVAKSQLLKFVEKVSPISVYTSGKGSSAAGLTASVIRDPGTGEFYLEGGAMVLADGGVVCIDEFDKMNEEDRVAIHEAMEQQTISIAKAGITTILNSRAAVLAAANPLFGRYDELKSPGDNIDFSSTILSRFDMIFVLKDEHNFERDTALAKHVLSIHMQGGRGINHDGSLFSENKQIGGLADEDTEMNDFDVIKMKRYISYCKAKCAPRLNAKAVEKLANHYVELRSELQTLESASTERSSIPITVRQLEAITRIAEALAKITLSPVASEEHVDEAIRLFRVSTMQAVLSGHSLEGMTRPDLIKQVEKIERVIKERVPIGSTVSVKLLVKEMTEGKGFPEHSVLRCVDLLVKQEKMLFRNQQKLLIRLA